MYDINSLFSCESSIEQRKRNRSEKKNQLKRLSDIEAEVFLKLTIENKFTPSERIHQKVVQ